MDLTYIIPVYSLCEDRKQNLHYILKLLETTNREIIVGEQLQTDDSNLDILKYKNVRHIKFRSPDSQIHKTKIINNCINFCRTDYFWMTDADFVTDFQSINDMLNQTSIAMPYIQPFEMAMDLDEQQTQNLFNTSTTPDEFYKDLTKRHINTYGALSFICNRDSFIDIGMMDLRYRGWGYEDHDFFMRIHEPLKENLKKKIHICQGVKGYHLHHPPSDKSNKNANKEIFTNKGYSIGKINYILKELYYPDWVYDTIDVV